MSTAASEEATNQTGRAAAGAAPPDGKRRCCPTCGAPPGWADERVIKRGAVTVALDPAAVWWRSQHVPLSQVEAELFAHIARRGRLLNHEIDEGLETIGASAATRSLVLGHIRRKFLSLGACDPFERLGNTGIRLRVDPDEAGSTSPVIGLRMPRYARVGSR